VLLRRVDEPKSDPVLVQQTLPVGIVPPLRLLHLPVSRYNGRTVRMLVLPVCRTDTYTCVKMRLYIPLSRYASPLSPLLAFWGWRCHIQPHYSLRLLLSISPLSLVHNGVEVEDS